MGDEQIKQPTTADEAADGASLEARHALLLQRDHVVGIEAEIGRQNAEILRLNSELRKTRARASRLTDRKQAQAKRLRLLQSRLEATRERNAALTRRVAELEAGHAGGPSLARRIARRLRGSGR